MNFKDIQAAHGPRTPSHSLTPNDIFFKAQTVSANYKARKAAEAEQKAAEKAERFAKIGANRPPPPTGCTIEEPKPKKAKEAEIEMSDQDNVLPDDGWVLL